MVLLLWCRALIATKWRRWRWRYTRVVVAVVMFNFSSLIFYSVDSNASLGAPKTLALTANALISLECIWSFTKTLMQTMKCRRKEWKWFACVCVCCTSRLNGTSKVVNFDVQRILSLILCAFWWRKRRQVRVGNSRRDNKLRFRRHTYCIQNNYDH